MTPAHTITEESVTVVLDGKTFTVRNSSPNFEAARLAAFKREWETIRDLAMPGLAIEKWLTAHSHMGSQSPFTLVDGFIEYNGVRIDTGLNNRLMKMAAEGTNPSGWLRFWARLQQNPSYRSVTQLYAFLAHENIPIDDDTGCILAYKSVTSDYKDFHTKSFDNTPGTTHTMPRNQISDDPRQACHVGFHVGALGYASSFGVDRRIVICKVDPADVVCVPYDSDAQKVRVCRYEVIGNYSGTPMPSTSTRDDSDDLDEDEVYDEDDDGEVYDEDDSDLDEDTIDPAPATETVSEDGSDWTSYDQMTGAELVAVSIGTLRRYARFGLQIFGASKILGGKDALIKRILEVRPKPTK